MIGMVYYLVVVVAFVFWLLQIVDLFMRDDADFESHTHKLTWFVVLVVGNLVGAIWYAGWKRRIAAGRSPQTRE